MARGIGLVGSPRPGAPGSRGELSQREKRFPLMQCIIRVIRIIFTHHIVTSSAQGFLHAPWIAITLHVGHPIPLACFTPNRKKTERQVNLPKAASSKHV